MNISARDLSFSMHHAVMPGRLHTQTNSSKEAAGVKETAEGTSEQTQEQVLIDNFKEEHSPENRKISQIYYKFVGGKKLTAEELNYLAEYSPELYKQVREIMMERQALEMRMKMAKTKLEVQEAAMDTLNYAKKTGESKEQEEAGATKAMARSNQLFNAYREFTASPEYKEKEDTKTQTEEMRDKLEESEEQNIEELPAEAEEIRQSEEELSQSAEKLPQNAEAEEIEQRTDEAIQYHKNVKPAGDDEDSSDKNHNDEKTEKRRKNAHKEQNTYKLHMPVMPLKWEKMQTAYKQSSYGQIAHGQSDLRQSAHKRSLK